jgi:peptidoglycan/LPS O-acetylase OafA/YrhL
MDILTREASFSVRQVQELDARTPGRRIISLDSLRGVAAFVVVWHHFRLAFERDPPRWYLRPFFDGHAAVVLFFVLSGYVLSIPFWRHKGGSYPVYLVRRFFRIYVPYAAAVLLSAALARHFLYSHLPLTPWFLDNWQAPITGSLVLKQLLEMQISPELNLAFWSLRYEVLMSIVFPLACRFITGLGWLASLAISLGLLAVGIHLDMAIRHRGPVHELAITTMAYAPCFLLGALLSLKRDWIARTYRQMPRVVKAILLLVAVIFYFQPHTTGPQAFLLPLGACLALVFAQYSRAERLLITPIPEYLGRVSYSMYLVHAPVLLALLNLLVGKVPFVAVMGAYLICVLVISHIFCIAVEEPALRLGKRAAAFLSAGRSDTVLVRAGDLRQ